jgi:hypothetical protein
LSIPGSIAAIAVITSICANRQSGSNVGPPHTGLLKKEIGQSALHTVSHSTSIHQTSSTGQTILHTLRAGAGPISTRYQSETSRTGITCQIRQGKVPLALQAPVRPALQTGRVADLI